MEGTRRERTRADLPTLFFKRPCERRRESQPRQSSVGRNRLKGFPIYRIHPSSLLSALISLNGGRFRARISLLHQTRRIYRYAGTCVYIVRVYCTCAYLRVRVVYVGGNSGTRKSDGEKDRQRNREIEREKGLYVFRRLSIIGNL